MKKENKLLLILAFGLLLGACNGRDSQEVIIVNKVPRGAFAGEEMPHNIGWYEIGLSRNGKEPIEYIWRAGKDPYSYAIMTAGIGDKGTIYLQEWAKQSKIKLPRPNAKKPPHVRP